MNIISEFQVPIICWLVSLMCYIGSRIARQFASPFPFIVNAGDWIAAILTLSHLGTFLASIILAILVLLK